jgi:hypothetical protein
MHRGAPLKALIVTELVCLSRTGPVASVLSHPYFAIGLLLAKKGQNEL